MAAMNCPQNVTIGKSATFPGSPIYWAKAHTKVLHPFSQTSGCALCSAKYSRHDSMTVMMHSTAMLMLSSSFFEAMALPNSRNAFIYRNTRSRRATLSTLMAVAGIGNIRPK